MTQLGKKQGKGKGGPKTPEGKARALANLKPFREKRDQHGVTVINPGQPEVQAVSQQIKDLLAGDNISHLRPADEVALELAAVAIRKVMQAEEYIAQHGLVNDQGKLRPVVEMQLKAVETAAKLLDRLGLSPASRAKLGLTQGRAAGLAEALAELEARKAEVTDIGPEANL